MPELLAEDVAQQLYESLYRILTADEALRLLLGGSVGNSRIYQSRVDAHTGRGLEGIAWVTYGITATRPFDAEQTQAIWVVRYSAHAYTRGQGSSDNCEMIEKRIRELLNNQPLTDGEGFFAWYNLALGYKKQYEAQAELWHVEADYETMCAAFAPEP